MTIFQMVKYHKHNYPSNVPLAIEEIAAHLDTTDVKGSLGWSLHTEYSYGKRNFDSAIIQNFPELIAANKFGVPQLWKNEEWASQFADFIMTLVNGVKQPSVIEIHPPFNDYSSIEQFVGIYSVFEDKIKEQYPGTQILVENRCGTVYRGKFILSKIEQLISLCERIEQHKLALQIAYDVPQIYTAHRAETEEEYLQLLEQTSPIASYIGGVHLWGKRIINNRKIAHQGDLNSYFGDKEIKEAFLQKFASCFDDGMVRKMVLEVNSGNEDLLSIVNDLISFGIEFR